MLFELLWSDHHSGRGTDLGLLWLSDGDLGSHILVRGHSADKIAGPGVYIQLAQVQVHPGSGFLSCIEGLIEHVVGLLFHSIQFSLKALLDLPVDQASDSVHHARHGLLCSCLHVFGDLVL